MLANRVMMSSGKGKSINDLNIGDKVKFGQYQSEPIIWRVAAKNHVEYPSDSITLVSDDILCLKAFDAMEPNGSVPIIRSYGNANYIYSNIRQWLNKSGFPWYVAQHSADQSPSRDYVTSNPYAAESAFLTQFTNAELNIILETPVKVKPYGSLLTTVTDKIFLLSTAEVNLDTYNEEGTALPLFTNNASRIAKYNGVNTIWLTRTQLDFSVVKCINNSGSALVNSMAREGDNGIRPAVNIKADTLISNDKDIDGCYIILV